MGADRNLSYLCYYEINFLNELGIPQARGIQFQTLALINTQNMSANLHC